MKKKTLGFYSFIIVLKLLNADAQSPSNLVENFSVSSNFLVKISGQETNNNIFACRVVRDAGKSIDDHALVLFEPELKKALVVEATNDVYFLKSRLFMVSRDVQSFWLTMSRPLTNAGLSAEAISSIVIQSMENQYHRENAYKKMIDLRPVLKSESDRHLAQPLGLRKIEAKVEQGEVVVYFESYTHIKGKVILDDQLNPISMVVTSVPTVEAPQQPQLSPPPQVNLPPLRHK